MNEEPAVKHSGGSDLLRVTEHETIAEEPLRLRNATDNRVTEVKIRRTKLRMQDTGFSPIFIIFQLILVNYKAKHPSVRVVCLVSQSRFGYNSGLMLQADVYTV